MPDQAQGMPLSFPNWKVSTSKSTGTITQILRVHSCGDSLPITRYLVA
jgi:hypothetical protein